MEQGRWSLDFGRLGFLLRLLNNAYLVISFEQEAFLGLIILFAILSSLVTDVQFGCEPSIKILVKNFEEEAWNQGWNTKNEAESVLGAAQRGSSKDRTSPLDQQVLDDSDQNEYKNEVEIATKTLEDISPFALDLPTVYHVKEVHVNKDIEQHGECLSLFGGINTIHPRISHLICDAPDVFIEPEH